MCHGSSRHCGAGRLESSESVTRKKVCLPILAATVYFLGPPIKCDHFDCVKNRRFIFQKYLPKKEKYAQKMVMTQNLAKNKRKTTCHAMDAVVDVRQNGFTRLIYNGNRANLPVKINLPTNRMGSGQPKIASKNCSARRI